jgi:hypothetical protein
MAISKFTAALAIAALVCGASYADETWTTEIGTVVYESDLENGQAVWSYPVEGSQWRGKAFLVGLASEYTGRTGYTGYWMEAGSADGQSGCEVEVRDPETDGTSDVWGRIKLAFVDDGTWVALRGDCFEEPTEMLVGRRN